MPYTDLINCPPNAIYLAGGGGMTKTQNSSDQIRRRIEGWLAREFEKVLPFSDPGALWHLTAKDKNGRGFDVAQLAARPDRILVQATIEVLSNYRQRLAEMDARDRRDFICDLRLRLLSMDIEYKGLEYPLEQIVVAQLFFIDNLNRNVFFEKLASVNRAVLSILVMLDKKLAEDSALETFGANLTIH